MSFVNAKCTSCGTTLEVDSSKKSIACKYCGSKFIVEEAIKNYNIKNQTEKNDFEIVEGRLIKYNGTSTDVVIPEEVTKVNNDALPNGVKSIVIPDSLTDVLCQMLSFSNFDRLFYGSFSGPLRNGKVGFIPESVEFLTVSENNAQLSSIDGVLFSKHCSELLLYPRGRNNKTYFIPDGVATIGISAFESCNNLTSVTIPNSVITIGRAAFSGCKNLSKVVIFGKPQIADDAFSDTPYSGKKLSSGCYVATCVYGSYDCPEVWTLRRYRDNTLAETWYGRAFIRTYYSVSPTIVKLFGDTKWFKKMWREKLDKMIADLQAKGVENTPYQDKNWK